MYNIIQPLCNNCMVKIKISHDKILLKRGKQNASHFLINLYEKNEDSQIQRAASLS